MEIYIVERRNGDLYGMVPIIHDSPNSSAFNFHYLISAFFKKLKNVVLKSIAMFYCLGECVKEHGSCIAPRPRMTICWTKNSTTVIDGHRFE